MKNKKTEKLTIYKNRLPLISWLILPLFVLWLSTNYLIGLTKPTEWQNVSSKTTVIHTYEDNPQIAPLKWNHTGLVTLWFDDAWYSQYSIAFPVMERNNFKGALAVPTNMVNGDSYMTWPQIERMQYKGWEIDSHSQSHDCNVAKFDSSRIKSEIEGSLNILRQHNIISQNYVSPCGEVNNEMLVEIKKAYLSHRSTDDGINEIPVKNPYHLNIYAVEKTTTIREVREWIKETDEQKGWLIIVFHQIGGGNDQYEISFEHFLQIIQEVKTSKLPVVLPTQALNISI